MTVKSRQDSRSAGNRSLTLNVLCLVLLVGILVGVYTIPRFNYDQLVAGYTDLLDRQAALEDRFGKINALTAESGAEDYAVLATIEEIPSFLESLREQFAEFAEFAAIEDRVSEIDSRLAQMEQHPHPTTVDSSARLNDPLLRESGYLEPLDLERSLDLRARRLSAKRLDEGGFENVLAAAVDVGILPFEDTAHVPPEVRDAIAKQTSLFRLNMMLVNYRERLRVQEFADDALRSGEFDEIPYDSRHEGLKAPALEGPGFVHVRVDKENRLKRVFRFSYDTYPELLEFDELRRNAKNHLVNDIAKVGSEWTTGPPQSAR